MKNLFIIQQSMSSGVGSCSTEVESANAIQFEGPLTSLLKPGM